MTDRVSQHSFCRILFDFVFGVYSLLLKLFDYLPKAFAAVSLSLSQL